MEAVDRREAWKPLTAEKCDHLGNVRSIAAWERKRRYLAKSGRREKRVVNGRMLVDQ